MDARSNHRGSPLETKSGRLWRKTIGLSVRRRGGLAGTGSDHKPVTKNGRVVLNLLLLLLLELTSLVVGLQRSELLGLLAKHVDHVRHGEVIEAVAPRKLEDKVGPDEVVAGIKHTDVALAVADVDELEKMSVRKGDEPEELGKKNLRSAEAPQRLRSCQK